MSKESSQWCEDSFFNTPVVFQNNMAVLGNNMALWSEKGMLIVKRKYFKKNLKKSTEIFGYLEIISYLCIILKRR